MKAKKSKRPLLFTSLVAQAVDETIKEDNVVHEHEHHHHRPWQHIKLSTLHIGGFYEPIHFKRPLVSPPSSGETAPVEVTKVAPAFLVSDHLDEIMQKKGDTLQHTLTWINDRAHLIESELEKSPSWMLIALYLILVGVTTAIIGVGMDLSIIQLQKAHVSFMKLTPLPFVSALLWVTYILLLVLFSVTFTQLVSPAAVGSGIPQIKTILSGVDIEGFFSKRTLCAKVVGLVTYLGSGMIAGKEGAFVHLACIMAHQLGNLNLFSGIFKGHNGMREKVLAAATALGVAANFGAPMSGVLFSIEVTSVYYSTRTYWFSAIVTVSGSLVFRSLVNLYEDRGHFPMVHFIPTQFPRSDGSWTDLLALSLFGVLMGLVAALFTRSLTAIVKLKRRMSDLCPCSALQFTYVWAIICSILCGILTFPGLAPFMGLPSGEALKQLVSNDHLVLPVVLPNNHSDSLNFTSMIDNTTSVSPCLKTYISPTEWSINGSVYLALVVFVITRFPLQLLSFSIPAPGGIYYPIAALGAALGRLLGEALNSWIPELALPPHAYALVGAGALPGGATGAISTAIIVVELTGEADVLLLVIVSTLIAVQVSTYLGDTAYVAILKLQGLPFLPDLDNSKYFLTAKQLREPVIYLERNSALVDLQAILTQYKDVSQNFNLPLVSDPANPILLGAIYAHVLEKFANRLQAKLREANLENHHSTKFDLIHDLHKIIHGVPIQFIPETPIIEIHRVFILSRLSCVFVTKRGKLTGMITRGGLKEAILKK